MILLNWDQAMAAVMMTAATFKGWFREDDGIEDSPSKLIWIAAAIVIAGAAVIFAMSVFRQAEEQVPDVPAPPG